MAINKTPSEAHRLPKITPPVAAEDLRITIDKEQAKLLSMQLDKEKQIDNNPMITVIFFFSTFFHIEKKNYLKFFTDKFTLIFFTPQIEKKI